MDKLRQNILDYIDQYLSAEPNVETFYHYTTINALRDGIIVKSPQEGKEVCLRATHRKYLNDTQELMCGIIDAVNIFHELFHKTKEETMEILWRRVNNTFLTSFTLNPDSLHMWNMYAGNGQGIAIGFKRIKSIEDDFFCLKCCYDYEELEQMANKVLEEKPNRYSTALFCACIPSLRKNKSYREEKEIRLVGDLKAKENGDYTTQYRAKNGYLIPFKEFYLPKEQIQTITLGPCADYELVKKSLRMFLDDMRFEHVKILKSEIPYRNNL